MSCERRKDGREAEQGNADARRCRTLRPRRVTPVDDRATAQADAILSLPTSAGIVWTGPGPTVGAIPDNLDVFYATVVP